MGVCGEPFAGDIPVRLSTICVTDCAVGWPLLLVLTMYECEANRPGVGGGSSAEEDIVGRREKEAGEDDVGVGGDMLILFLQNFLPSQTKFLFSS